MRRGQNVIEIFDRILIERRVPGDTIGDESAPRRLRLIELSRDGAFEIEGHEIGLAISLGRILRAVDGRKAKRLVAATTNSTQAKATDIFFAILKFIEGTLPLQVIVCPHDSLSLGSPPSLNQGPDRVAGRVENPDAQRIALGSLLLILPSKTT